MVADTRTVLVVGASRGLGLGLAREYLARGWRVVATTRGRNDEGLRALATEAGSRLRAERLDVTDGAGITGLARALEGTRLDLLFVSAGISGDTGAPAATVSPEDFARVMATNAQAPLRVIEALAALVPAGGAVAAMSSILGSVAENTGGGYETYRASKAALNTLLRSYAARHAERSVIAMHPGWVRTDMGGANAAVSVTDSARGMAEVIETRLGKPGCAFLDWQGRSIPW